MPYKQLIVLLCMLCKLLSSFADPIESNYNFELFMTQFQRNYTGEEKMRHQQIFNFNFQQLLRMRSQGQDVSVNTFLDWNQTQKRSLLNFNFSNIRSIVSSPPKLMSNGLFGSPSSFDWKSLNRVTSVKNQGICGSCWAFASIAQFESALTIANNGTIMYDLAQQYAIECSTINSHGCGGGMPHEALKIFNSSGVPLQTTYPYKGTSRFYGKEMCETQNTIKLNKSVSSINNYQSLTIEEIQNFLYNNGPLTVGVKGDNPLFLYAGSSGSIKCFFGPTDLISHVVLLYGYNSTHWFIKNSWGTSWGNQGYAYIEKAADCGITFWIDVMEVDYNSLLVTPPPPLPGNVTLNIRMKNINSRGWNGNVLGLRQNGVIIAKFGENFTDGGSLDIQKIINGRIITQIVAVNIGTHTDDLGFLLTFQNTTEIIDWVPNQDKIFGEFFIFFSFCPLGDCPPPNITLTIQMSDSYGDGWQNTILAFNQNEKKVGIFGQFFINGKISIPQIITIPGDEVTDIVVFQKGSNTKQIGFVVKSPNGTIIYSRTSGEGFNPKVKFTTFCPIGNCKKVPTSKFYLTLQSSCNGWGANVLSLRQEGILLKNFTLTNLSQTSPIQINVKKFSPFQIIPLIYGQKTWEIGFVVRSQFGGIVGQRQPGSPYHPQSILLSYNPGVSNEAPVFLAEVGKQVGQSAFDKKVLNSIDEKSLLILTIIFGAGCLILLISFITLLIKYLKLAKQEDPECRLEIQSARRCKKKENDK